MTISEYKIYLNPSSIPVSIMMPADAVPTAVIPDPCQGEYAAKIMVAIPRDAGPTVAREFVTVDMGTTFPDDSQYIGTVRFGQLDPPYYCQIYEVPA